ncbi:hypothetical protein [Demequina gelatinilytica]|uniref:hypothetical protein n=1 Tax=Demequina gelatinilytica TaxID=1638980 RepID=UPI000782699A|nr:hypothetical protein [Demequina gelatinilytica]
MNEIPEMRDLLHQRHHELATSMRHVDEFDEAVALKTVTGKRRGRAIVRSTTTVACVAVLAAGAFVLFGQEPAPITPAVPITTPSESPTPTPSPATSTAPTEEPSAEPTIDEITYVTPTDCPFLTPDMIDAAAEPGVFEPATPTSASIARDGTGYCTLTLRYVDAGVDTPALSLWVTGNALSCDLVGEGLNTLMSGRAVYCADDVDADVGFDGDEDDRIDMVALVKDIHATLTEQIAASMDAGYSYDPALPVLTVGSTTYQAFDLRCTTTEEGAPYVAALTYGTPDAPIVMSLGAFADHTDAPPGAVIAAGLDGDTLDPGWARYMSDDPAFLATPTAALSFEGPTATVAASDWLDWSVYTGFGDAPRLHTEEFSVTCPEVEVLAPM